MNHSRRPANGRAAQSDLLAAAFGYHGRGWSVIPMAMGKKRPARKWKEYQTKRASEAQLRAWFGEGSQYGIGVVFGEVSGRLTSRDFDNLDAYRAWASAHPDLARTLPTVETRRGMHVYCIAAAGSIEAIRAALAKPNGTGAIAFDDGELRAGVGCYSVLPPSVHPSGHVYRWEIPPGDVIPVLDLSTAGFVGELLRDETCATEAMNTGVDVLNLNPTSPILLQSALFSPSALSSLLHERAGEKNGDGAAGRLSEATEAAIRRALPTRAGVRNRQIFRLARELKAISALANAQASDLMRIVRRWYVLASPIITTKPWDDTWFDFLYAWPRVKHPAGQEPIALAFERAAATEPPEAARQFDRPEIRLLVTLCRELQLIAGDSPFFLDARTAGKLFKTHPATAWRWLRGLCDCKILSLEAVGDFAKHRASRYRYVAPP